MAPNHSPSSESQPSAGPPAAVSRKGCALGVVMTNSLESGCFEDKLSCPTTVKGDGFLVRQGVIQGRHVAVAIAGGSRQHVVRATEALIFGHGPRLVAAAGFASGLDDRLERGDLIVADAIRAVTGESLQLDRTVDRNLLAATPRLRVGRLLAIEQPVHRPAEKRSLAEDHEALAADAQSLAVAKVCRSENVPVFAVRVIIDAAGDELPVEARRLTSRKTAAQKIGAIAGSLVHRPSSIKDLWNVYESSLAASETLAKFLEAVAASLSTP